MNNTIYYLYEILGVKIGITQNIERRRKEQKDKGELIILGEYTDIYLVSEKERELQEIKGYHIDKHPYWYTVTEQNRLSCTEEAKAKHKANNDFRKASIGSTRKFTTEQVISIRKRYSLDNNLSATQLAKEYKVGTYTMTNLLDGRKYSEIPGAVILRKDLKVCPHCGKKCNFGNYARWHGDRCKKKGVS